MLNWALTVDGKWRSAVEGEVVRLESGDRIAGLVVRTEVRQRDDRGSRICWKLPIYYQAIAAPAVHVIDGNAVPSRGQIHCFTEAAPWIRVDGPEKNAVDVKGTIIIGPHR